MHEGSAWDRSGTTELIGSTRRSRRRLILHLTSQAILCVGLFFKIERVITESTVKAHMKAILRKLGLQNRTQAALAPTPPRGPERRGSQGQQNVPLVVPVARSSCCPRLNSGRTRSVLKGDCSFHDVCTPLRH